MINRQDTKSTSLFKWQVGKIHLINQEEAGKMFFNSDHKIRVKIISRKNTFLQNSTKTDFEFQESLPWLIKNKSEIVHKKID